MKGAVYVALAATIGNFLQGWDNATIAGAIVYIKSELELETTVEGLVVAMSLIGATVITTFSGAVSDMVGRRPMLIASSILYFISGLVMLWSPNVYVLLLARLLDGFGIGLAVTLVPIYISETAPTEIRGQLNTLPQFTGSGGMFLSYCMIFGMSLETSPSWRIMLGVLSIPSLVYLAATIFFLPESPRWLVSKGRMTEAKKVLQRLRGVEDVSVELALLVEGLGVGGEDTKIEEYTIGPGDELTEDHEAVIGGGGIKLYGPQGSWIAKPVTGEAAGQSMMGLASRHGSMVNQSIPLMDPLVPFFGSVHEKTVDTRGGGSMLSTFLPNFGSMFSSADPHHKDQWEEEEEEEAVDHDHDVEDPSRVYSDDDNLEQPLMSRQTTSLEKQQDMLDANAPAGGDIGGNWQLAWQYVDNEAQGGGEFKRMYIHQDPTSRRGSLVSMTGAMDAAEGDYVHASALVSSAALYSKDQHPIGPAMLHPSHTALNKPSWASLLDPGVKRALAVGIGIQILQQFSGINGVLYYTPQILEEAGVSDLLDNLGLSSTSSSFLISGFTTLLMLPCIAVAMRLMDISGRRSLLLATIPVLIGSLVVLIVGRALDLGSTLKAIISTTCVIIYFCTFVMAYGPIPNILCSEIFPTRVRGICIAICALVYWISDIIVTYTLPVMLTSIGLSGIFGIYAVVCVISWVFIYLKVPETKGMPLEVIIEFFAVGARQFDAAKDE